jgi:hypothetical protein
VVEWTHGVPGRVPVLLGAAESARAAVHHKVYRFYLPDEARRQQAEEEARAACGAEAYAEAFAEGRRLDLDGSVALALAGRDESALSRTGA